MGKKLRKIKPKKSKSKIVIIIVIIVLCVVLGLLGYKFLHKDEKEKVVVKILDSIDKYGYYVDDRDSELYKEEFHKLKEVLNAKEVDEQQYSEQVARLFVVDLYSMENKLNKYDIGGKAYFYSTKADMFGNKVVDTLYSNLKDDSYGDRKQELPSVKSIKTESINEDSYKFIETSVLENNKRKCTSEGYEVSKNDYTKCFKEVEKVYVVELTWEYEKDMGYDDEASIVIAKEDNSNRWSVVEFKPKLGAFK